jgi:hypothetical protein
MLPPMPLSANIAADSSAWSRRAQTAAQVSEMWGSIAVQMIRGLIAVTFIAASPACADDAVCAGAPDPESGLALGHIAPGAARVHFVKAPSHPGCPDRTPTCEERAYLVPGDRVILAARRDAFVCATYVNAKAGIATGWLPAAAVADDKAVPIAPTDWLGKWSRDEAEIIITAGQGGTLQIGGEATRGAHNPDHVKGGTVSYGEIDGEVMPAGDRLSFAMGDVDKGDERACKVWMQRIGPWLVVRDSGTCGGIGVSFLGIYTRKP